MSAHDTGAARFDETARRILDALLAARPERATTLGDHRHDDELPDLSADGVAGYARMLIDGLAALDDIDDAELDTGQRVDLEVLRNHLTGELWTATEPAPHLWDPLLHLPVDAVNDLVQRPGPDPGERLRAVCARLAAIPAALDTARRTLQSMPPVHVETAIAQAHGLLATIDTDVAALAEAAGGGPATWAAISGAARALREHADWLAERLTTADRNPRLGPAQYAATLWYTLDSEIGPDALLTRAESDLMAIEERMAELASRIAGAPPRAGQVREVLDTLAATAPVDAGTLLPLCRDALALVRDRVDEVGLATVPDDPLRFVEMPESKRGVAVAYCDPPGPLEPAGPDGPQVTLLAVAPAPASWSAARVASFYREYNGHMLRSLIAHEAIPGHALQLAHARRGGTPVRAVLESGPFVEGWAVYAEELLAAAGLGDGASDGADDALQMVRLKMQLRSTINAIIDVRVHTRQMTEAEAMELMIERGHQEEGEAAGKWRRALLTSAQLATYYAGYREVSAIATDLRAARPGTRDRDIHDAMLAHGSPPPRHLRTLLDLDRP